MLNLIGLIRGISLADAIDILMVAGLFYFIFHLLRGTRSNVALRGMITLLLASFLIYFLASTANLASLKMIFSKVWIVILLVFVIVFQNEFKKALTNLGQIRAFRVLFIQSGAHIEEIVKAVRAMSTRHVGALIAIERRNSLRPYAATGTPIDSLVQSEILRTIFTPYSPLHDGAVVIANDRLVAAACILPLTARQDLSNELGTRHRAAIGLSEETDAVVVVVSEETGAISLALDGHLERHLTAEALKRLLEGGLQLAEEADGEETGEKQA